ncbi:hypothetical protein niasHT_029273 [Heterodera trifolii]|uniref:Uncharacterized protein n=1 Tax=Heterodera trifolii TaxID=157864 RepID=A0ABD2KD30_9BILA
MMAFAKELHHPNFRALCQLFREGGDSRRGISGFHYRYDERRRIVQSIRRINRQQRELCRPDTGQSHVPYR